MQYFTSKSYSWFQTFKFGTDEFSNILKILLHYNTYFCVKYQSIYYILKLFCIIIITLAKNAENKKIASDIGSTTKLNSIPFTKKMLEKFNKEEFVYSPVMLTKNSTISDGYLLLECLKLPHSNYLSEQDIKQTCKHRIMWLRDARTNNNCDKASCSTNNLFNKFTKSQAKFIINLQSHKQEVYSLSKRHKKETNYMGLSTTNNIFKKSIRKEIRMLTTAERTNLTLAMNILKHKLIDNITVWDLHTIIHYPDSAIGAHWGPAFLPWHREFLHQFETALKREVPGVALPYWDSTLDHDLPEPSDSVMWMDELMGNGNGYVKTGPFKNWNTNVLMPLSPIPVKKLFRSTGGRVQDRLLSVKDLDWILSRSNYSELTFCHDKTFESMHGLSHVWVGGFMFVIRVSPNDPMFYMHHAFIDYIWEQFRQKKQNRNQRKKDYAHKICNKNHGFNAPMIPFNLKNKDGLSNDYTDFWYEYQPVRHCDLIKPFCDSPYLFCDLSVWRCKSRVQLGGNCTGFANKNICYNSMCIKNICRIPATEGNGYERNKLNKKNEFNFIGGTIWTKTLLIGNDNHPLYSQIAHITIKIDSSDISLKNLSTNSSEILQNHTVTAFIQRNSQYPEIPGILYLPLPQPTSNLQYNVSLEARDHYGRYCQSYCFNGTNEKYQVCEPKLYLKSKIDSFVSNISYTHSYNARRFLDMDLSTHPKHSKIFTPYMLFSCRRKVISTLTINEISELIKQPLEKAEYVWFPVTILKKSHSLIKLDNLQIEAENLDDTTDLWISSIRKARSAYDKNIAYVRARNPSMFHNGVRVRIALRTEGIRLDCDVKCNLPNKKNETCNSNVFLHEDSLKSQEKIFASDPSFLQVLGWKMIGHPTEWRFQIPYLTFYC